MIGPVGSSPLSVLSAQRLQAQRDAQTARAKAERLAEQSQQAAEEARQATQRSERLERQSQAYRAQADSAQQRAEREPAQIGLPAPARREGPAPSPLDDPLPANGLSAAQQLGRRVLSQAADGTAPSAIVRSQALRAYATQQGGPSAPAPAQPLAGVAALGAPAARLAAAAGTGGLRISA